MRKLMSMTDYVLGQYDTDQSPYNFWKKVSLYGLFLKQPLKLGMFVPCDKNDKPLELPEKIKCNNCHGKDGLDTCCNFDIYQQGKERVLFYGFELVEEKEFVWTFKEEGTNYTINVLKDSTIEDLQIYFMPKEILLTEPALKEYSL